MVDFPSLPLYNTVLCWIGVLLSWPYVRIKCIVKWPFEIRSLKPLIMRSDWLFPGQYFDVFGPISVFCQLSLHILRFMWLSYDKPINCVMRIILTFMRSILTLALRVDLYGTLSDPRTLSDPELNYYVCRSP